MAEPAKECIIACPTEKIENKGGREGEAGGVNLVPQL